MRSARSYRPQLELLESRTLLSTFTVDHLVDDMVGQGQSGSLRYCITNGTDGDSIQFGVTGTINLTGALPDLSHSISIEGPGPDQLTVDGSTRKFKVLSGATVSISGLTVAHGYVSFMGGGIFNAGTLTLNDATLIDNHTSSAYGGGIWNEGILTISGSTFIGNTASSDPGVFQNTAADGGGIYNNNGMLTVSDSTFSHNGAGASSFYGSAASAGGGIYNHGGTLAVSGSTFSGNSTYGYSQNSFGSASGGGIANDGMLTISGSTFSGNFADSSDGDAGGGIANSGTLAISDSTFSGNYCGFGGGVGGGGISNYHGILHARNTIIAGNRADLGPDFLGDLGSFGYNLIGDTQGGSGFDPTDLLNVDPLLGPLQDNGGPTQTMALLPGSPALNAGDPNQLGTTDQRGVVRTGGVNIGAYQASASAFLVSAPDTVSSGVPFDVTITAVDSFGQVAVGYTGTVRFSTSDPDAGVVLPADYTFTANDGGVHNFSGGFTLVTPGDQTLTVTDTTDDTINGNATITVMGGNVPWRHERFWVRRRVRPERAAVRPPAPHTDVGGCGSDGSDGSRPLFSPPYLFFLFPFFLTWTR
jgi:hypothetical protein